MGAANGNLGGIGIVLEATYGTTPGSPAWTFQHPMPSTIGLRRPLISPNLLTYAAHSARGYAGKFVDGDLVVGLEVDNTRMGSLYRIGGNFTDATTPANDYYTFGDGSPPDDESISVLVNYGGGGGTSADNFEYWFEGIKPNAMRWDLVQDSNSYFTMSCIGEDMVDKTGSASTINTPDESNVFMPTDLAAITVGGESICLYSATIEYLCPKTGFDDRRCMGGNMKEPVGNGRPEVRFTLNVDLDDATDNNTDSIISAFISGTTIGTISIADQFSLSNCTMEGDFPALQEGNIEMAISGTAEELIVYVGDNLS